VVGAMGVQIIEALEIELVAAHKELQLLRKATVLESESITIMQVATLWAADLRAVAWLQMGATVLGAATATILSLYVPSSTD
jgi:hypothetical protein